MLKGSAFMVDPGWYSTSLGHWTRGWWNEKFRDI